MDLDAIIAPSPENDAAAVEFIDRNRDQFNERKGQLLLLLLAGGSGERALQDAINLSSFAREASFEIAASPTRADARKTFTQTYLASPEEWLRQWRSGELQDDLENNLILGEALELEGES